MAEFTIGLSSNVISGSRSYTLTDEHVTRWIDALRVTVPGGGSKSNGQLLVSWADDVMKSLKNHVLYVEEQHAAANVTSIDIT